MTATLRRCLLFAIAASIGNAALAQADSPYLFSIPVDPLAGHTGPLDEAIQATLHVPDSEMAARIIAAGGALDLVSAGDGRVAIAFDTRRTLAGEPDAADRADTFVVDYSESAVIEVLAALRGESGDRPTVTELTEFVFRHIDDKSYLGTFDLASKVAATRGGDCTEHAVLLAALARATGQAARVALGVVLVETDDRLMAFGHAWTEIHNGSSWQLADATMPENGARVVRVRYLPLISLDDEGPGYSMDLARLAPVQPARVSGIGNATGIHETP